MNICENLTNAWKHEENVNSNRSTGMECILYLYISLWNTYFLHTYVLYYILAPYALEANWKCKSGPVWQAKKKQKKPQLFRQFLKILIRPEVGITTIHCKNLKIVKNALLLFQVISFRIKTLIDEIWISKWLIDWFIIIKLSC